MFYPAAGVIRVLGVDPGLTRCGFGVIDGTPGRPPTMIGVGVARTSADLPTARRLVQIEVAVAEWIEEHRPDKVAVERVFAQHNLQTVVGTAQAAGVAMLVAARKGLPVELHTPSEVKAAITGSGRADKRQIGEMVTRILRLETPPKPADAADALALAICHLWRGGVASRYADAAAAVPARNGYAEAVAAARGRQTAAQFSRTPQSRGAQ